MSNSNNAPVDACKTQSYIQRLGIGFVSAAAASIPLSMGVTVFDRSVIQFVNGSRPSMGAALVDGFKTLFRSPISTFLKLDNRAVYIVYSGTYISKNSMEATSNYMSWDPFWPVLIGTTCVNTTLGILKDRYLAQMFGSGPVQFPLSSYGFFTGRDLVIIGASFHGPQYVTPWFREKTGWDYDNANTLAQLLCPGLAQIVATPLHIMGLDVYNRPTLTFAERMKGMLKRILEPLGVRMCRQMYVFGLGSIAVKKVSKILGFYEPTEVRYVANLSSSTVSK
jgi:hypothetical protein